MGMQFGINQPSFYQQPQPSYYQQPQPFFAGQGGQFLPPPPPPVVTGFKGPTTNFGYNSYKNLMSTPDNQDISGVMITNLANPNRNVYHDVLGHAEAAIEDVDLDGSGTYNLAENLQDIMKYTREAGLPFTETEKQRHAESFSTFDQNNDGVVDRLEQAAQIILTDSPDAWALREVYGGNSDFVPKHILGSLDGVVSLDDAIAMEGLQKNSSAHGRLLAYVLDGQNTGLREAEKTYQSPIQHQPPNPFDLGYPQPQPAGPQNIMTQMFSMMTMILQQIMQMFQR